MKTAQQRPASKPLPMWQAPEHISHAILAYFKRMEVKAIAQASDPFGNPAPKPSN